MTLLQLESGVHRDGTPGIPTISLDAKVSPDAQPDDSFRWIGAAETEPVESDGCNTGTTPPKRPSDSPDLISSMPIWLHPIIAELQVDSGLAVANLLSAISLIAGKNLVLVDEERRTYPNLFITYGCPPAFGKSVVQEQIFAPLNRIETEQREHLRTTVETRLRGRLHEISYEITKIKKTFPELEDDENALRDACEEIAELDLEALEIKSELARTGIFLINDATPAGLKKDLATTPNHFVAMILSDGRELLSRLSEDHYKTQAGSLCQILLTAYSGDRITISRASGTRHHVIDAPRMTLLALAQTDILCKFFTFAANHQSGLASRMLFFESLEGGMRPGNLSTRKQEVWATQVKRIHSMAPTCPGSENGETPDAPAQPLEIHFSDNARKLVAEIESALGGFARNAKDKRQEVMWDRAGEQLRRLAFCRALLRKDFPETKQVNRDDFLAASMILKSSVDTFTRLCESTSNSQTPPQEVLDLRKLVVDAGGSLELLSIKQRPLSDRKARAIARAHPNVFTLCNAQSGKVGKPRKIIRLKDSTN